MNNLNLQVIPFRPEEDHVLLGYIQGASTDNFYQPIILDLIESNPLFSEAIKSVLIAQYNLSSFKVDFTFTDSALASVTSAQTGKLTSTSEDLSLNFNTKKVKPRGIEILPGNTWGARVENGFLVDSYIVTGDETSSSYSWVSLLIDDELGGDIKAEDTLIFLYTLPESYFKTNTTIADTKYPGASRASKESEVVNIVDFETIKYSGDLRLLTKIKINNTDYYTGTYSDTPTTEVLSLDYKNKIIKIGRKISPKDVVVIEYYSHPQNITYSGFGSGSSWYGFDCNPEYSHKIKDLWGTYNTADILDKQIALYLEPSSVLRVRFTAYTDIIGDTVGAVDVKAWSCFDTRVATGASYCKYCLKHKVYDAGVEFTLGRNNFNSANSWGFATLGVNYYDENTSSFTFDVDLPYCLPIGKIMLSTISGIESTLIRADNYGGGIEIPDDEDPIPDSDNLMLKSLFNVGTWGGGSYNLGGEILVKISSTVLNTCTEEEVYELVRRHIPPDVVFTIKYI